MRYNLFRSYIISARSMWFLSKFHARSDAMLLCEMCFYLRMNAYKNIFVYILLHTLLAWNFDKNHIERAEMIYERNKLYRIFRFFFFLTLYIFFFFFRSLFTAMDLLADEI
jgi:hypothetical protein